MWVVISVALRPHQKNRKHCTHCRRCAPGGVHRGGGFDCGSNQLKLTCCGARRMSSALSAFVPRRPRPLAQVASSATGGAPIAPPVPHSLGTFLAAQESTITLHLLSLRLLLRKIHLPHQREAWDGLPRVLTHPRNDGKTILHCKKGSASRSLLSLYLRRSPKPSKYAPTKIASTTRVISIATA